MLYKDAIWDKNVGTTYRKLVNKIFEHQVGRNMEIYVNDMIVKTRTTKGQVLNFEVIFSIIRRYDIRLNPNKCVFGVILGNFLEYLLHQRG